MVEQNRKSLPRHTFLYGSFISLTFVAIKLFIYDFPSSRISPEKFWNYFLSRPWGGIQTPNKTTIIAGLAMIFIAEYLLVMLGILLILFAYRFFRRYLS